MDLYLRQLSDLWGPPVNASGPVAEQPLGPICTDSRLLTSGSVFIPLVGERFDGHAFLPQAAALAAQAAVVCRCTSQPIPPGLLHWLVDDTLEAYQQLALLHRRQLTLPVIAVTGSAGKTTTRELLRAVLSPLGTVLASTANNNNDVGVPLTLLQVEQGQAAAVVEMGMRGPGEIERLSGCSEPDIAVITNIGTAHIGRLGSRAAIAAAKCEITASLKPGGFVVIPAGDPLLEDALKRRWTGRVVRVALADDGLGEATPQPEESKTVCLPAADLVGSVDLKAGLLSLDGDVYSLPLEGRHNARNLLLALAVARALQVPSRSLRQLQVEVPGGRNRRVAIGALSVLDETYNASPEAVLAALELLAVQPGRRFAVLGTMLELGDQSVALHRRIAERVVELALDGLVVVASGAEAEAMAQAAAGLSRLAVVDTPEAAALPLNSWLAPGDVVLLKASRGVALERLLPLIADAQS